MSFIVVIPARYGSSRLPGKPLAQIAGRPMIQHVHERAVASGAAEVIVATDDERIAQAVAAFGGRALMTDPGHRSGTDRVAEVVERLGLDDAAIVVNLQGDEPLMPPALMEQVAGELARRQETGMATLCVPIATTAELFDPHVVKVVRDRDGNALYFSRAVIPWDREAFAVTTEALPAGAVHYRHIGLYAYRAGFIREYVAWPSCRLEEMESLEQLRVLWHGKRIHVAEATAVPGPSVDTRDDLERVERLLAA
ncbi:MAG TPA: 3-deoxy-manno-octulosonate cytidylyltransferase [Gammaproteobacteria bacterium]|nr:3-deoxy-manno-octulosonate cytidylyltransferase [Gammaproteobacteria bacterium]